MLAQNHAAGADEAANEENQTEPPHGIEAEVVGKGKECSAHASDGCRVGGNLPPDVDEGADNLYDQGSHYDRTHEMRHVKTLHHVDAGKITDDGNDVRHHTPFAVTQLDEVPALIPAVEVDEQGGEEDGEQIGQQQHLNLVRPGEHAEIAERKEYYQSDDGQIEWREHHTHDASSQDELFLSFHFILSLNTYHFSLLTSSGGQRDSPAVRDISLRYDGQWDSPFRPAVL